MWTSNSGDPFNQPSNVLLKLAYVMYSPGPGAVPPVDPPLGSRIKDWRPAGPVDSRKSVSARPMAMTGVSGGVSGCRGFRPPDGDDRGVGRSLGVQELPPALGVERNRNIVILLRGSDQEIRIAAPASPLRRDREIHLDRRRLVEVRGDGALRLGRQLGEAPAGAPLVGGEEPLEVDLALPHRAGPQGREHRSAESVVTEGEPQAAGEPLAGGLLRGDGPAAARRA